MAKIKKTVHTRFWQGYGATRALMHCSGSVNGIITLRKDQAGSYKTKKTVHYDSAILVFRIYSGEMKIQSTLLTKSSQEDLTWLRVFATILFIKAKTGDSPVSHQ